MASSPPFERPFEPTYLSLSLNRHALQLNARSLNFQVIPMTNHIFLPCLPALSKLDSSMASEQPAKKSKTVLHQLETSASLMTGDAGFDVIIVCTNTEKMAQVLGR